LKKKAQSKTKLSRTATEHLSLIDGVLVGWPNIAKFLGQPVSVVQRWAKNGMPVQRKGRSMIARPGELSRWLGKESRKEAVHIAQAGDDDMLSELRRALKEAREEK
jgi:phage terminase Nu1 subunit (DNA packaging protein)